MAKKPKSANTGPISRHARKTGHRRSVLWPLAGAIAATFLVGGLYAWLEQSGDHSQGVLRLTSSGIAGALSGDEEASLRALAAVQADGLIVDVHEHIESIKMAPVYLEVMDELGIRKMCLMGSSKFTLTMNESYGFTGYDENNEALMEITAAYPDRFEVWPTLSPTDPENLTKLKGLVARGASGLKLYTGHGYVTRSQEYLFHPVALDDPNMLPIYAYCEANYLPLCLHVNPYDDGGESGKPGFAQEFVAILQRFPDLKVDAPHFILSSVADYRLREFFDAFPNVYSNISFGDSFMAERLRYISKNPTKFRDLFHAYKDRFMFASDLVLDEASVGRKTPAWVRIQMQAYLDMLTKETYVCPEIRDKTGQPETLRGLTLPPEIIQNVLYKNYERFVASRPQNTEIGVFDWKNSGVKPIERRPGETFPPRTNAE